MDALLKAMEYSDASYSGKREDLAGLQEGFGARRGISPTSISLHHRDRMPIQVVVSRR